MGFMKKEKMGFFLGGIAAALIGTQVAKSEKTREVMVTGMAKGMKLQSDAQSKFQSLKEDAQDLCYDAKVQAGQATSGGRKKSDCEDDELK